MRLSLSFPFPAALLLVLLPVAATAAPSSPASPAAKNAATSSTGNTVPLVSSNVAPTTLTEDERLKFLENKLNELEQKNAALEAKGAATSNKRLEDLTHDVEMNYPSAYEKAALNITILITDLAVIASVGAIAFAFMTLERTRLNFENNARSTAANIVNSNNKFLAGRFSNSIAIVLSEIAWDPAKGYELKNPSLAKVAVRYQLESYTSFRAPIDLAFAPDLADWTLKSLNNLIFMLSSFPAHPESSKIEKYLAELKTRPEFEKNRVLVNTYTNALLVFRGRIASTAGKTEATVLGEVKGLIDEQWARKDELQQISVEELKRITNKYEKVVPPPQSANELSPETGPSSQPPASAPTIVAPALQAPNPPSSSKDGSTEENKGSGG